MSFSKRTKTNRLTIYMIKPKFQRLEDFIESPNDPIQVEDAGQFLFEESHPHPPGWIANFFGNSLGASVRIVTASAKGVFVVPVTVKNKTIYFVIAFGVGRHLLKDGVIEERFGLKVVLNSVGRDSFRSIDKTTLGSVPKHSKEQMSRNVAPADFGIDIEQDLVSLVTAISKDEHLGKIITGKDALSVSVPINMTNIADFLAYCHERFKSADYKTDFDWIDQIAEVRSATVEDSLNAQLIKRINQGNFSKMWMAVPEVVDWSALSGFRYLRAKRANVHDDLRLDEFLSETGEQDITVDVLKHKHVFAISAETDEQVHRWPAYSCLYAEIELSGSTYVLNNGKWYEIASGFVSEVQRDFVGMKESDVNLPEYTGGSKLDYNTLAANAVGNAYCMDQQMIIHGGGHSRIEFCDILTSDRKLIHVKKYGGSSVLSHLFSQGAVSGELLVSDGDFRSKVIEKLPRGYKQTISRGVRPDASQYEIVYAIISGSDNPLDLPFFSKVSLRNARRRLMSYGFSVTKKKIAKNGNIHEGDIDS